MSNITGLAFAPILLAPLIVKLLDESQKNGNGKGWSRFKDKTSSKSDPADSSDRMPTDTFEQIRDRIKFGSGL